MIRLQVRQGGSCWLFTLETMLPAAESASDFTAAARIAKAIPPLGGCQSECQSVKRSLLFSKALSNAFRGAPSGTWSAASWAVSVTMGHAAPGTRSLVSSESLAVMVS